MATGTVSSATGNPWQTISTNTPTSGTTVTFSSISGYKTLMLAFSNVTTASAAGSGSITFNGSSTNYSVLYLGSYLSLSYSSNTLIPVDKQAGTNGNYSGYLLINDAINPIPKTFTGVGYDSNTPSTGVINGVWVNTSAITSITFTSSGAAFSGSNTGTFTLYGIAA